MTMPRHAKKRDLNEKDIVDALKAVGAKVIRLDAFDLLVRFRGSIHMVEVKNPEDSRNCKGRSRRTENQERLVEDGWPLHFVTTCNEALAVVGARRSSE